MKVLFLLLFLSIPFHSFSSELLESAKIEQDISDGKLALRTEKALGFVILTACGELRKKGFDLEAEAMETEWFDTYQHSFRAFASGMGNRDIGDHKPLSQWLSDKYQMLESLLGVEICKKTHLSDIKTFNYTIPIVFRPCTFQMDSITIPRKDEYRDHFSYGGTYYGLVPVVAYWVIYGATAAGTMGTGFTFLSGIAGNIAEKAIAIVTPRLSDSVYNKFCGGLNVSHY